MKKSFVCPKCKCDFTRSGDKILEQYAADVEGSYLWNYETQEFEYEEECIDNGRDFIYSCGACDEDITEVASEWLG